MNFPNFLTVLRVLLTPFFYHFFTQNNAEEKLIGVVLFFIASFTDWYDGYYARKHNIVTRIGQFLDPLADKILVLTATIIFVEENYTFLWIFVVIAIRDVLVTLLRMFALYKNQPVITSELAKWKTAVQMATLFLIMIQIFLQTYNIHVDISLAASYLSFYGVLWLTTAILSVYTCIAYLIENRNHIVQIWRLCLRFLKLH